MRRARSGFPLFARGRRPLQVRFRSRACVCSRRATDRIAEPPTRRKRGSGAQGRSGTHKPFQGLAFPHLSERCKGFPRDFGRQSLTICAPGHRRALIGPHQRVDLPGLLHTQMRKRRAPSRAQAASCVWIGAEHQQVDGLAGMATVFLTHAALHPLVAGITSQISTPGHRKAIGPVPLGLGPDRVCSSVACVSPLVSQTRKQQPRNGKTTLPDTAIARLKARSQFLAHEELWDDHTLVD